jgi:hypothetical protein
MKNATATSHGSILFTEAIGSTGKFEGMLDSSGTILARKIIAVMFDLCQRKLTAIMPSA